MYEYNKEDEMEIGCNCSTETARGADHGGRHYIGRLQRDLASSYYWSGNCCKDYMFFIANWHPLLGMCLSHPAHPWSKVERIGTFIFSCSLTLLPSAMFVYSLGKGEEVQSTVDQAKLFCVVTLPVMIWEIALYWVAIGDIFCKGRGPFCDFFSRCFTCFKHCCMCWSLGFSFIVLAITAALMLYWQAPVKDLVYPFCMSRLQSWVTWFPIMTFLPCVGFLWSWCAERKDDDPDYPLDGIAEDEDY